MNRSLFLHVVERLEGLVGRLPATIQRPILSELTPLKELFLKQRPPRFVFTGSANTLLPELMTAMFPRFNPDEMGTTHRKEHWRDYHLQDHGTISILDARSSEAIEQFGEELESVPADVILFVEDEDRKRTRKEPIENLLEVIEHNRRGGAEAGVIGIIYSGEGSGSRRHDPDDKELTERGARLHSTLESKLKPGTHLLRIVALRHGPGSGPGDSVISAIAGNLPNAARIETARVFMHRPTQMEIAQLLVKSTTAICTAIGAQPIPLADLPILTTLQLVMVILENKENGRTDLLRLRLAARTGCPNWAIEKRYIKLLAETGATAAAIRELQVCLQTQWYRAESWQLLADLLAKTGQSRGSADAMAVANSYDVHLAQRPAAL